MMNMMKKNPINDELNTDLESDNSETIGGLIIDILGEIPDESDVGKEVEFGNYKFKIDSIKERRIEQITMKILPVTDESESAADQEKQDKKEKRDKREKIKDTVGNVNHQ